MTDSFTPVMRAVVAVTLLLATLADGLLAAGFLYLGIRLWPGGFPG